MEWIEAVKQHWVYELGQAAGIGALLRYAVLEVIRERRRLAVHEKNSAKIDWLIRQVGAIAVAHSVTLEDGLDDQSQALLKELLHSDDPKN